MALFEGYHVADAINIKILNAGAWARTSERVSVTLPMELEDYIPQVEEFYRIKHSGRKLQWHHLMSNGIVSNLSASLLLFLSALSVAFGIGCELGGFVWGGSPFCGLNSQVCFLLDPDLILGGYFLGFVFRCGGFCVCVGGGGGLKSLLTRKRMKLLFFNRAFKDLCCLHFFHMDRKGLKLGPPCTS